MKKQLNKYKTTPHKIGLIGLVSRNIWETSSEPRVKVSLLLVHQLNLRLESSLHCNGAVTVAGPAALLAGSSSREPTVEVDQCFPCEPAAAEGPEQPADRPRD